jgi:catechol 2,3-dioxygenase-like lactoylglutathione lyase family enzyme
MSETVRPKWLSERPKWRGLNHLALVTTDMDATVRFYHGVLGARLVATLGTSTFRHYFFEFGPASTVAFFEYRDVPLERMALPAGVPDPRKLQFDHLSLDLADEQALLDLRRRLVDHDCEVTEVVDHGFLRSIYFTDPNGIALEATHWVIDPTAIDDGVKEPRLFLDESPVPAVAELLAAGEFTRPGPRTSLS